MLAAGEACSSSPASASSDLMGRDVVEALGLSGFDGRQEPGRGRARMGRAPARRAARAALAVRHVQAGHGRLLPRLRRRRRAPRRAHAALAASSSPLDPGLQLLERVERAPRALASRLRAVRSSIAAEQAEGLEPLDRLTAVSSRARHCSIAACRSASGRCSARAARLACLAGERVRVDREIDGAHVASLGAEL